MALEPAGDVRDGTREEPPALLGRPVDAAPALPPVRTDAAVTAVHQQWARVHAGSAPGGGTPNAADTGPGGWRSRVHRAVTRAALDAQRPVLEADRALIGDLIRAADALALRCDALADRVVLLEHSLAEVVDVLGADLARLRAEVAARRDPAAPPLDG